MLAAVQHLDVHVLSPVCILSVIPPSGKWSRHTVDRYCGVIDNVTRLKVSLSATRLCLDVKILRLCVRCGDLDIVSFVGIVASLPCHLFIYFEFVKTLTTFPYFGSGCKSTKTHSLCLVSKLLDIDLDGESNTL